MICKISNHKKAMIVLHEIYGINCFIEECCTEYNRLGYDVFCPDMLRGNSFPYFESEKAYQHFIHNVGFEFYREVTQLVAKLYHTYDQVFIIGFSVGATIAWRCCANIICSGIICCYGSRIRDYTDLHPSCPVLLLFAENDSFDVDSVIRSLKKKPDIEIYRQKACHGFIDPYSKYFNEEQAKVSKEHILKFLAKRS